MHQRLAGRTAIVTGGSSGIGRGICLRFAAEGARVVVADLSPEPRRGRYHETDTVVPAAEAAAAAGGTAWFVRTDVAEDGSLAGLVAATVERWGGVDILVNNAGVYTPGGLAELPLEEWDRLLRVNLRAAVALSRLALPHLKQSPHGRVLHVASVHASGGGGGPAYPPAKAALVNLAKDMAVELGPFGVTVNAISPGYVETAIQDYLTPEQIAACRRRTPLPRLGRPADIAAAAAFLASDEGEWITGIELVVDGGFTAPV